MKCHVNTFNHYATAKDCAGKDVLKSFPYIVAFPFYEALKHPTNRSDPQREDFQYLLGPETMKTKSSTNSPVRKKKNNLKLKLLYNCCHLWHVTPVCNKTEGRQIYALSTMVPRDRVLMHTYPLRDLQSNGVFKHSHLHNPLTNTGCRVRISFCME